jgi:hypothetical protein
MTSTKLKMSQSKIWQRTAGFILGSLLSTQAFGAQATAASMTVSVGSSNGTVSALALASEGKVVNLYTNGRGNLNVVLKFSATGLSSSIGLSARLRQHSSSDTFTFQAQNSSGGWVPVVAATGGTTYKTVQQALPSGIIVNGVISLRLISSVGADDLDLDQLILVDQGSTTLPPTTTTTLPPSTTTTTLPPTNPPSTASKLLPGTPWYWQLQGTVNTSQAAKVYDIDLYDNSAATFASLKASGHIVICYFSAGTYEDWRSDANQFPAAALGSSVDGWPGENWLDVRNATVRSIMAQRMDLAKSKGCDGLEPDNVDGYSNKSGFPLTAQDQINFNSFLADQAHARGMIVALKNSTDLVSALVSKFDFAVVEECWKYNECSAYSPFVSQNKAVLNAEYTAFSSATCTKAAALKFSTVFFNLDLNGNVFRPCP